MAEYIRNADGSMALAPEPRQYVPTPPPRDPQWQDAVRSIHERLLVQREVTRLALGVDEAKFRAVEMQARQNLFPQPDAGVTRTEFNAFATEVLAAIQGLKAAPTPPATDNVVNFADSGLDAELEAEAAK